MKQEYAGECRVLTDFETYKLIPPDKRGIQTNLFFYFFVKSYCGYSLKVHMFKTSVFMEK